MTAVVPPIVYLVPHQDDETLTMGADIATHTAEGRDVHVVLVTNGQASAAAARICQQRGVYLSTAEFIAARNTEFVAAIPALGVPAGRYSMENIVDGTLTAAQADSIIDKYLALYPGAAVKTMSWLDRHNDHYQLGYALLRAYHAGKVTDARWDQYHLYQAASLNPTATYPVITPAGGWMTSPAAVRAAIAEYRVWNPAIGRYSVAQYSARGSLDYIQEHPSTWYHRADDQWRNPQDAADTASWIAANQ